MKKGIIYFVLVMIVASGFFMIFKSSEKVTPRKEESPIEEFADKVTQEIGRKMDGEIPKNPSAKFAHFPVRMEDFLLPPKVYGMFPFGVKGEGRQGHSEGHPGWDFELKKGSKLYAVADLKISEIHEGDHQDGGQEIQVIEAGTNLGGKNFRLVYHSVVNLEPGVKAGAIIPAGSPLAEIGYPISDQSAMTHFGVFPPGDSVGSCPTPFFADELQPLIAQMVALSFDFPTGKSYPSACVGKLNRKEYEKNNPDMVKYLGGNEEWE